MIPFAAGATNLAASDVNAIHTLAASLNSAVANSAAHVQLYAYGGARGDKSSDSRRLSLKRGLVVRELLIEDGIPSEKIDVHAMGGADDPVGWPCSNPPGVGVSKFASTSMLHTCELRSPNDTRIQ